MHETFRIFVATFFLSAPLPLQTGVQIEPFNSIELPQGGHVTIRPSPMQRVTLVRGSSDYTRWSVADRGALVINRCFRKCPRGYRLEIEIATPSFTRIALANGGTIQTRSGFPRQSDLAVAVAQGGTIDVRSIAAQRVTATVEQGGRILTAPRASLVASVSHGGVITWWGEPQVTQSIEQGGVVNKGELDEIDVPLSEVGLPLLHPKPKPGRVR